jgi:hypothetical protein
MAMCAGDEDCATSISRAKWPMVRWRHGLRGCGHMCEKGMRRGVCGGGDPTKQQGGGGRSKERERKVKSQDNVPRKSFLWLMWERWGV